MHNKIDNLTLDPTLIRDKLYHSVTPSRPSYPLSSLSARIPMRERGDATLIKPDRDCSVLLLFITVQIHCAYLQLKL